MIYDKIDRIKNYSGISEKLDKALKIIDDLDPTQLQEGRNEIDENIFIMKFNYQSLREEDMCYEAHKKYIDIQLVTEGSEYIRCYPRSAVEVTKPYDAESDAELYEFAPGVDLLLENGSFALFMPDELHAPKLMTSSQSMVSKIVVKILA